MHPDNNPMDLAAGQLYVKDPETGETLPLSINMGSGDTLAEFTVPDTTDPDELARKAREYLRTLTQDEATLHLEAVDLAWHEFQEKTLRPIAEACQEWLAQIVDEQYTACMKWAQEHRRKWLHIGRTTKKARTRKKYAKLIWRDYKAAHAAALDRIAGEG